MAKIFKVHTEKAIFEELHFSEQKVQQLSLGSFLESKKPMFDNCKPGTSCFSCSFR